MLCAILMFVAGKQAFDLDNNCLSVRHGCQVFILGCNAQRLGVEFTFDRKRMQITNNREANFLLKDKVRPGWEQYYKL